MKNTEKSTTDQPDDKHRNQSPFKILSPPNGSPEPQVVFPPVLRRPCFLCYDAPFWVGNDRKIAGVYFHFLEEEKDALGGITKVPVDKWICSVLKVLCIVRSDSGRGHSYLLEYSEQGNSELRRELFPQSALLSPPEEAFKALRDAGVSILFENVKLVRAYLDRQHSRFSKKETTPDDFWRSVKSVGWAQVGQQFVLPNEIIGEQNGVWFDGRGDVVQYSKQGDLAQWRDNVAQLCSGNNYLLLALGCALAGPLLELLNIPGLGIHLYGDSTTGKTTALRVATSVWGSPKFMLSWRTTVNGLEIQAASRSSTLITLDESHMAGPKELDASVYMLLNGTSKARMNRDASARELWRWFVCVLSSGERSIETHLGAGHIDHKVGQGLRIIDVPVVGEFGLFDDLHDGAKNGEQNDAKKDTKKAPQEDGSVFADKLREASAEYYGHAGPLFVQHLIDELSEISLQTRLADVMNFVASYEPPSKEQVTTGKKIPAQDHAEPGDVTDPIADKKPPLGDQEKRVARAFAVAGLAGELAIEWGILPLTAGCVKNAAAAIFKIWRETQPKSTQSKEHAQVIERILDAIHSHGDARFSDLRWTPSVNRYGGLSEEPVVHNRMGYWDESSGSRIYLFYTGALREVMKGFDFNRTVKALNDAGAIVQKDKDRYTKRERIHGKLDNFYYIDPAKLTPPEKLILKTSCDP